MLRLPLTLTIALVAITAHGQAPDNAPVDERPWLSINTLGHTAAVRALAFTPDSKRLCSAGLDKVVHVWNTSAIVRDLKRTLLLERSIRWQVGRGLRGSIYSVAIAPNDGLLAVGGYGATGALGEILLVDPVQGTLQKTLQGHRQTVCSLAFSADGAWLASLDVAGQLILWKRGDWQPSIVYETDDKVYGAPTAALIERQPNLRPIAMVGSTHVIIPVFVGAGADGRPNWRLQRIGMVDRKDVRTFDTTHVGMVSALAVSADGSKLASGDLAGNLFLGETGAKGESLKPEGIVLSLAFDPKAETLVAGTAVTPATGKGQLQLWNVATRELTAKRLLPDNVSACAISPDGKMLASTGGEHNAVFLGPASDLEGATPLRGAARRVVKVAFAKNDPPYRVAFGSTYDPAGGFNNYGPLERSFDTAASELSPAAPLNAADWLDVNGAQGRWRAQRLADGSLQLFQDNVAKGVVRFDPRLEGTIRSYCWLAGAGGEPTAIAVGTDVQNSIYVCQLAERGSCPILRHFRGHNDYVTSIGASRDGRYLVSGSADGTVRIWSLSNYMLGRAVLGRWGVELAVNGNALTVSNIDPAGPLYFKGVRIGDMITRIRWPADKTAMAEDRAAAMLQQLSQLGWDAQIVFETSRAGAVQPAFQLLPAWQPLANLYVTADREWAFWTPEGYYDASTNGHTLFGWQVNRGLNAMPDFFRADQFRKKLERPDVLENLLPTGNLDAAFRKAALDPPKRPDQIVERQIEATPRINILVPKAGETLPQSSAIVRARIRLPKVGKLNRAKVFANGVVAPEAKLVEEVDGPDGKDLIYEWQARLPADERNMIQVVANTDSDTVGFNQIVVERPAKPQAERAPKLYVLAMGINQYRDQNIQPLAYSVADATSVVDLLEARAAGLYTLEKPTLLVNNEVTRSSWKESFTRLSQQLRSDARADDLLVIFLAGHGFVDPASQRYYFAGYDLSRDGYLQGDFSSSISWNDFELLSDIPCRKLAFLDTCHSGAIQQLRNRNLKAAVRAFQEDVVFTVTASAGHERSEEKASWQHGAFTKTLLEALSGQADLSGDGVVTLNEVVQYVQRTVPELTDGRQNPTAAPEELLPFVSLRLTAPAKVTRAAPAEQQGVAGR